MPFDTAPPKIPVTVIILTLNEAMNLPCALAPLTAFEEVVVVDSHSVDDTAALAAAAGARVVPFAWNGRPPKKKQWSLENATPRHDWVLMLDADEVVTPALIDEMRALFRGEGPRDAGYFIDGHPVFMGRRLRHGWINRKLCLFNRHAARFPALDDTDVTAMWEVEGHFQPIIDGSVARLHHPVIHHDRKPISAWFIRHARYAEWEARLGRDGRLARLDGHETRARRWAKRLLRHAPAPPLTTFLVAYVIRLGFLDGWAGFHHAVARAFYRWQVAMAIADDRATTGEPR